MPVIDKVLYTEACPFEYDRFPDSRFSANKTFLYYDTQLLIGMPHG